MDTINISDHQAQVLEKSIRAMTEFKAVFGRGLSGDFAAELHAAKAFHLRVLGLNQPGYDALGQNGERYQIKYRSAATQNVDVNSFDFDYLVLVNLDEEYHLTGLWRITASQARDIFTPRVKFRKHQATQNKIKSIGEFFSDQDIQQTKSRPVLEGRPWNEIRGKASYPLLGEDAQQWVTRSRQDENKAE